MVIPGTVHPLFNVRTLNYVLDILRYFFWVYQRIKYWEYSKCYICFFRVRKVSKNKQTAEISLCCKIPRICSADNYYTWHSKSCCYKQFLKLFINIASSRHESLRVYYKQGDYRSSSWRWLPTPVREGRVRARGGSTDTTLCLLRHNIAPRPNLAKQTMNCQTSLLQLKPSTYLEPKYTILHPHQTDPG